MRSRLWNETYKAVAFELNNFLKDFGMKVDEVHADLNASKKYTCPIQLFKQVLNIFVEWDSKVV